MDDLQQAGDWLLLQRIDGVGPQRTHQLLNLFPSPSHIFSASDDELVSISPKLREMIVAVRPMNHPLRLQVEQDLDYLQRHEIQLIHFHSDLYPALLRECQCPPPVLYVKGDPLLLTEKQLAVVGARKAGKSALQTCFDWSAELSQQGLLITSGLALGVDAAAHHGALSVKEPTIAVLAHGMDMVYPRRHQKLAQQIAECGALVSEFPLGTQPRREHFPQRNRIISGLSLGVLVAEAAIKSGSLITAQYAIEQNREVFAIPGMINNPLAQGCNLLIKQGAWLVDCAEDILQALNWQVTERRCTEQNGAAILSSEHQNLLAKIPFEAVHLDQLLQSTALNPMELTIALMELEVAGMVENLGGNYQRIR